ncbi:Homeobox protein Nkx-3 [Aphelenchoides besseyi]|nr:Homeobox protein Nkx-3 [Aphelenchoides besseyi]KAI6201650.1 Homeobox protein Nkx-3 [Aphelenchoides besseyi]
MSSLSSSKFTIDCLLGDQKTFSQLKSDNKSIERPAASDINRNGKSQRRRSTFTAIQVHVLESEFLKHRYVSPEKRAGLAAFLGLSQQQVKIWYQNRRYKSKTRCVKSEAEQPPRPFPIRQSTFGVPLQSTAFNSLWFLHRRTELLNDFARQALHCQRPFLSQLKFDNHKTESTNYELQSSADTPTPDVVD